MQPIKVQVPKEMAGQTLLSFLRGALPSFPSVKAIKRAIDAKRCKINGRVEYFSTHPVRDGDTIEITFEEKRAPEPVITLYEDEELIILNKPPGRVSESFEEYFLVHRLDKETSGALLFAKTASMQKELESLFFKREAEKEYLAICDKEILLDSWKMESYLEKKASYDGGVLFGSTSKEKGKKALTYFQKIKSTPNASLVLARPVTGRTHQIRIHLKEKGHPVLGDWQYEKKFQCPLHPPRLMLHAQQLTFVHPRTKEKLNIRAPLFDDFLEVQKSLFGA